MRRLGLFTLAAVLAGSGLAQAQNTRISVNGGAVVGSTTAGQNFTFPLYAEDGRITNDIDLSGGAFFDIGGAYRVTSRLWAGVAFTSVSRTVDSSLSAQLPHPFYFNQARTVDATVEDLDGKETSVHISLLYPIAVSDKLEVALFGGPTRFSVTQDLVTGLDVDDTYPYDSVTVNAAETASVSASAWGGHVGADISYRLTPMFSVGGLIRFARGSATLDAGNGDAVSISPGGLMVGGGVRVVF